LGYNPLDGTIDVEADGKIYRGLRIFKPFPITRPEFIMLLDPEGSPALTIKDVSKLPKGERERLEEVINRVYFIPKILSIRSLNTSGDEFVWRVLTDRGEVEIRTRGRHSLMKVGRRVIIIDTSDMVYEIEDIDKLDKKSRKLIEEIV